MGPFLFFSLHKNLNKCCRTELGIVTLSSIFTYDNNHLKWHKVFIGGKGREGGEGKGGGASSQSRLDLTVPPVSPRTSVTNIVSVSPLPRWQLTTSRKCQADSPGGFQCCTSWIIKEGSNRSAASLISPLQLCSQF